MYVLNLVCFGSVLVSQLYFLGLDNGISMRVGFLGKIM